MRRALAVLFVAQFVLLDVAMRGVVALATTPILFVNTVASVLFWTLAASLCSRKPVAALVASVASANLVLQVVFFRYYHAAVDVQVVTALVRSWADVKAVLVRGLVPGVVATAILAVVEYTLIGSFSDRIHWRRPLRVGLLVGLVVMGSVGPGRAAAREISRSRGMLASSVHVAARPSSRKILPSILFLL